MAELENQGTDEETLCTLILHDNGTVTMTGTRFDAATAFFGDVPAALTVGLTTPSTAERPSQGADTAEVCGEVPSGLAAVSEGDGFTGAADAPATRRLGLTSGSSAGSTVVTVTGAGFGGGTGVSFGRVPALVFVSGP